MPEDAYDSADVVPSERFEPDSGPEPDVDPLRVALANVFDGLDDYAEVVDPVLSADVVRGSLSGDVAAVASDLAHGMRHFESGRVDEALWWWQFSYLSNWGSTGSSALRALHSVVSHVRLDTEIDEQTSIEDRLLAETAAAAVAKPH